MVEEQFSLTQLQNRQNFVSIEIFRLRSDVWWTASIFLETFVMLPQLRLMAVRKSVEGVTSHAIACTFLTLSLRNVFTFLEIHSPNDHMFCNLDQYEYLCNRE